MRDRTENYSHRFLVVRFSLYLARQQRAQLAETPEARQLLRTVFESKRDPREVLRALQKNLSKRPK